jgi:hypothetical protein
MESADEYEAGVKISGSWRAWKTLAKNKWFLNGRTCWGHHGLVAWREEMKLRDASQAKAAMLEQSGKGNVQAARTILDQGKPKKQEKPATKSTDELVAEYLKSRVDQATGKPELKVVDGK